MGRAHPIVGKTPVQTVHADFPHTAYQVVVEVAALRGPRILNRPPQAVESQGFEEGAAPDDGPAGVETAPGSLHEQGAQPFLDVRVHLDKLHRRITRAKVLAPAPSPEIRARAQISRSRISLGGISQAFDLPARRCRTAATTP